MRRLFTEGCLKSYIALQTDQRDAQIEMFYLACLSLAVRSRWHSEREVSTFLSGLTAAAYES